MESDVEFPTCRDMSVLKVPDFGSFWSYQLGILNLYIINFVKIASLIDQNVCVSLVLVHHMCLHTI